MTQKDENVKIVFKFFSNVLDDGQLETMWAKTIDKTTGLYKLDKHSLSMLLLHLTMLYLQSMTRQKQQLIYRKTIHPSGNSTIQVVIMDKTILTNDIRNIFIALGCISERIIGRIFRN